MPHLFRDCSGFCFHTIRSWFVITWSFSDVARIRDAFNIFEHWKNGRKFFPFIFTCIWCKIEFSPLQFRVLLWLPPSTSYHLLVLLDDNKQFIIIFFFVIQINGFNYTYSVAFETETWDTNQSVFLSFFHTSSLPLFSAWFFLKLHIFIATYWYTIEIERNECFWLLSNTINSIFYLAYRVGKTAHNTAKTKLKKILNVFPANMEIK